MMKTALSIIQSVRRRMNLTVPSTLLSLTDPDELQMLEIFYAVCEELRGARCFPVSKRTYSFTTMAGRSSYQLPKDFYAAALGTQWNEDELERLEGPLSDAAFTYHLYGEVSGADDFVYRIWGPDQNPSSSGGQFVIYPTPSAPAAWIPAYSYNAGDQVLNNERIYTCTTGGVSADVTGPTGGATSISDGTAVWTYAAWQGSTQYTQGQYVYNGGYTYICLVSGTSGVSIGATGPTGFATSGILDGTVEWGFAGTKLRFEYISRNYLTPKNWAASTAYTSGVYVNANGNIYLCDTNGTSGSVAPSGTGSNITDGTTRWDYVSDPYESVIADTDLCIFDNDLVKLGIRAKWLEEKGGDYEAAKYEFETKIDRAVARMKGSFRGSFCRDGSKALRYSYPSRSWSL